MPRRLRARCAALVGEEASSSSAITTRSAICEGETSLASYTRQANSSRSPQARPPRARTPSKASVMTIRAMMPRARTSRSRTPRALSDARGSSETRGPDRESRTSGLAGAPARRRTSGSRPASRTTRPGVPRNGRRWLRDSSTETHRLKGRTARGAARRRAIRFRLDNAEGAEVLGRSASPPGASAWRASSSLWQWCPQLIAAAATALELIALRCADR